MIDSAIISWLKSAPPSATTSTTHSHFLMDYQTRKQKIKNQSTISGLITVETERLAIHLAGKTEGYPVTNWLSEFPFRYIFTRIKGYIISSHLREDVIQLASTQCFLIISPQIGVNIHKQIWNRHLEKVSTHLKNVRYVRYISQNGNLP